MALLTGLLTYYLVEKRIKIIRAKAAEKMELQQQLEELKFNSLNASINPHFIFNALNSIQHFINKNDKNIASDYLAKFARLIRLVLDYANEKEISIGKEIERLTFYMQLEQNRFNHQFKFTIDADASLHDILIPNMLLQPLVENAILHGVKNMPNGLIQVSFVLNEKLLTIKIDDNGVGITTTKNENKTHQSVALINIAERLLLYPQATITISNKKDMLPAGMGTLVTVCLYID